MTTPSLSFFIPPSLWPDQLPSSPNQNWAGYSLGHYAWTVQTYMWLKAAGVACELTSELPAEGIVFCHSNALRTVKIAPAVKRLLICMKAEAPLCATASMHIVQNPSEASAAADRYYIPHWPQPQLIPRNADRGDRFETVAFFGHENSLADELQSRAWQIALAERGLRGRMVANGSQWNHSSNLDTRWNDYSDVDAIIAVRSFSRWQRWLTNGFTSKPATKLYNAWLGGTIAVLGIESAYRQTGQPGQDYVEVKSFSELLDSLDRLKADVAWRRSLIAQGSARSQHYTPEKILRKWEVFLEVIAVPAYAEWCEYSPQQRQQVLIATQSASYLDRAIRKGRGFLFEALSA